MDDEPVLRRLCERLLASVGYEVTSVSSAQEALEVLGEPFCVIVTDLQMPAMDGLAFVGEIRRRGIKMPVVVMSGCFNEGSQADLGRLGVTMFLDKPFNRKDFLSAVTRFCSCRAIVAK